MKNKKAIILFILTITSMILGFAKESAIVYTLGATVESDIFIFASNLPIILFSSIGTVISTTFMPIYTDIRINDSIDEANSFASIFNIIIIIICMLITAIIIIFPKILVEIMAPGIANESIVTLVTRVVIPSIIFLGVTSIIVGALESHNKVEIAVARQIPFNLFLIIAMIVVYNKFGFVASVFMILMASIIQLIFVAIYANKINLKYRRPTNKTKKHLRTSFEMIVPMAIGVMAMQINSIVSTNLASTLGTGNITKLNLANKLNMASYNTLGYLIVILIFPILAQHAAKKDYSNIGKALSESIVKSAIIMSPIIIIIFVLSKDIVTLFFGNEKFLDSDIIITTNVLKGYLIGLIFWAIKDILNRAYYSLKETKISMKNGIVAVGINIVVSLILIKPFGIVGLAVSTSLSSMVSVMLLVKNLNIIRVKLNVRYIIIWLMKLIIPTISMVTVYFVINNIFETSQVNKISLFIKITLMSLTMLMSYSLVLYMISKKEVDELLKNR